jgi:hypothetical protein
MHGSSKIRNAGKKFSIDATRNSWRSINSFAAAISVESIAGLVPGWSAFDD